MDTARIYGGGGINKKHPLTLKSLPNILSSQQKNSLQDAVSFGLVKLAISIAIFVILPNALLIKITLNTHFLV
ncbi:hypothetical protein [Helicobacter japonicus]|uniref:hypothetical protein n=1 Tax=Helicobacter japonicus TaxID=425400 RepID=UPI0026335123|nr:hypothetical protein [Helicobacter japonicus]